MPHLDAQGCYKGQKNFQERNDNGGNKGDNRNQDIAILIKTEAGVHDAALFLQTKRGEGHERQEHGRQIEQKTCKTQRQHPVDAVDI